MSRIFTDPKNQSRDYVKTLTITLNPQDNSGESVELEIIFYKNSDGHVYTNFSLISNCYGTSSTKVNYYNLKISDFESAFKEAKDVAASIEKESI